MTEPGYMRHGPLQEWLEIIPKLQGMFLGLKRVEVLFARDKQRVWSAGSGRWWTTDYPADRAIEVVAGDWTTTYYFTENFQDMRKCLKDHVPAAMLKVEGLEYAANFHRRSPVVKK